MFRQYGGRRVPFSCFVSPYSFSAVAGASYPVFMFCAPRLVFGGSEGVKSRFNVLRPRTRFRRWRGHQVLFSCFAVPDTFSAVWRASFPVFMFCAPKLIFGGTDGVRSHFHNLRSRTRFRRCGGRQISFSCFARPNSFATVPMASCPVLFFCAPGHVFGSAKGVGSHFHVLRSQTRFRRF
jgi:hypothetical protein